jgi:DNA-binding NarL/FixJ family response regulator
MKLLLIDDDKLVCSSLQTILEATGKIEVAAVGHSGEEAARLYPLHLPDILLMDIRMGEKTGLSAAEEILADFPDAKILFLTTFADDEYIIRALKIGAKGYLLKQNFQTIITALEAVSQGQSVFGDDIIMKIPALMARIDQPDFSTHGITEREGDIIALVADGLSNKEIAARLFLSEGTVRNYISTILEKLQLRDRTQLAVFYFKTRSK